MFDPAVPMAHSNKPGCHACDTIAYGQEHKKLRAHLTSGLLTGMLLLASPSVPTYEQGNALAMACSFIPHSDGSNDAHMASLLDTRNLLQQLKPD